MNAKFLNDPLKYDGTQLRSLFNYLNHDLQGDALLAFIGPCAVSLSEMVDGEDKKANAVIRSDEMLHFIIEIFHQSLFSAVGLQRIMADLAISEIKKLSADPAAVQSLRRAGDDIYRDEKDGPKKLSISIATSSPVSQLIHFAINTTTAGTPVPTVSLKELKVDPKRLAQALSASFVAEFDDIFAATTKVHWVK